MIAVMLMGLMGLTSPALADDAADVTDDAPAEAATAQAITGARVRADLVLKVTQRETAADELVARAAALGGYFSSRNLDAVTLRVPVDNADALLAFAAEQGLVASRQFSREDISATLTDQQARLDTRRVMLEQYFALLPQAGVDAVLTVEREITYLVAEIEQLEGALKLARHQAAFATVGVSFQFRDRAAPTRDGSSSFAWLNTLNLADILQDFQYDHRGEGPRAGLTPTAPEGFSAYRKGREYRAVSPDEVVYRVRAAKHEPEAELAFWREAVRVRMAEAGYTVLREQTIATSAGREGALIELAAPFGQTDFSYLIAVFPAGRKIILVEAAGEVERFEARREAMEAAILSLNP